MEKRLLIGNLGIFRIMKRLIRYQLDFEKTVSYALNHMGELTSFSRLIKSHLSLKDGHFFVDLPEDSQIQRLYEFDSGGMTPKFDCGLEQEVTNQGKVFKPKSAITTTPEVTHQIYQLLDKKACRSILFDDILSPSEKYEELVDGIKVSYFDREVYYAATCNNTFDELETVFSLATQPWRTFGALMDAEIDIIEILRNNHQSLLLDQLRCLIFGAYDGEAYVVWQADQMKRDKTVLNAS